MNRIIISREVNPYYNLALEEELLRNISDEETILYLWQNERTVVIGRNQNPYSECNLEYMKENDVFLVRRISGGGTVFHDLGNLNFTFITKEKNIDLDKQLRVIKKAIESFGLKVEFSGRNDLLLNGRKFSGHAFYSEDGKYFHHGTLMIDVNIKLLEKVLNPSEIKLQSKGIKSVKSRVINLVEENNSITVEKLTSALVDSFENIYGKADSILEYNKQNYSPIFYEKYKDGLWNFGESPRFDMVLEERLGSGNAEIHLNIEAGIIVAVKIFSDTIIKLDFTEIESKLINEMFSREKVIEIIEESSFSCTLK